MPGRGFVRLGLENWGCEVLAPTTLTRVRYQPLSVRRDLYLQIAAIALHPQGDPPELENKVADRAGLTRALSLGLAGMLQRRRGHDPGLVVRDLAVMLADGGECVSDLGGLRDQLTLFGAVASNATAYRVIERIACEPEPVDGLRAAHAQARAHASELGVKPARVTIDLDATLITAHSDKQAAAGSFKGGFGFAPIMA